MRQYTTPKQTTKLIELGFEKPNMALVKAESLYQLGTDLVWRTTNYEQNYSIGELIALLPTKIQDEHDRTQILQMTCFNGSWRVKYTGASDSILYINKELIDALFEMIITLKKEGKLWKHW